MKKILLTALLFLSLMVCMTSAASAGHLEDLSDGAKAYKKGDFDEATRFYTSAISSGKLSQKDLSAAYALRGMAWFKKSAYDSRDKALHTLDKAIADLTKAIELDPQLDIAYYYLGLACKTKGDDDKAIANYTKAIEIDPRYDEAYCERGMSWYRKSDYDKAIADFTKAIEINPKNGNAYAGRSWVWGKKGDYDKANADWAKAKELGN